jgi:hypothetical protein
MISEPIPQGNGTWVVNTPHGPKTFSDGETATDFYLLNKHREDQKLQADSNGNPSNP